MAELARLDSRRLESTRGGHTRMYYIYILKSQNYPKTYVGITTNLDRRLQQHNSGYHFYTRRYIPWIYIYSEYVDSRITARTREKYLKSAAGRKWINEVLFN